MSREEEEREGRGLGRGWLEVRNLSMTDAEAAALLTEPGSAEPGCDPRDGFFSYRSDTFMDRVVSRRPPTARFASGACRADRTHLAALLRELRQDDPAYRRRRAARARHHKPDGLNRKHGGL